MTTAPFTIQAVEADRRATTGSADDLPSALQAAWVLNRHIEGDVEVIDNFPYNEATDANDGTPFRVALVQVTLFDGTED